MNPLDFRGPEFLAFYAALIVITLVSVVLLRRARERSEDRQAQLTDPYLIALLRGGKAEMVRIVAVSLVDRGLLEVVDTSLKTTELGRTTQARREIERRLLEQCLAPRAVSQLGDTSALETELEQQKRELQRMGLLPDEGMKAARLRLFIMGVGVLVGVAGAKIAVALSRGRTNIGFLILMAIVAFALTAVVAFPRLTASGSSKLAELRNLFNALKLRAAELKPGGATSELAMVAAVYGGSVLPAGTFPWARSLFPQPAATSSTSSCSSSSCGSSCGGGGGGCGGCGS